MDISQSVPRMAKRQKKKNPTEKKQGRGDSLKVVYISSPMKVKTSASRFMSLVQQLTGKNSDIDIDIGRHTEFNDYKVGELLEIDLNERALATQEETTSDRYHSSSISNDTTTCDSSNSLFQCVVHDGLTSRMEEQFAGIFGSNSFCDHSLADVLGSYDEL